MKKKDLETKILLLEDENKELRHALLESDKQRNELQTTANKSFHQSPDYIQLINKNKVLESKIKILENRLKMTVEKSEQQIKLIEELRDSMSKPKNRGAGRKKADAKWMEGFSKFKQCMESQKSINETMEELAISRSTYYRYKKIYKSLSSSSLQTIKEK